MGSLAPYTGRVDHGGFADVAMQVRRYLGPVESGYGRMVIVVSHAHADTTVTDPEAGRRLAFADAALGAAGHQITDPYLDGLALRQARGEISGDEARDLGRQYIVGRQSSPE